MTKRSACRNQLLNEVEGAEDAGTSRAFTGSASPTQRCTCQFRLGYIGSLASSYLLGLMTIRSSIAKTTRNRF